MLDGARELALPALVVGLPPAGDPAQDCRVRDLSQAFGGVAAQRGVPFVDVFGTLCANAAWTAEAAAGDGAHPGAGGYAALARLVLRGGWLAWLAGLR